MFGTGLTSAIGIVAGLAVAYLALGAVNDVLAANSKRRFEQAKEAIATVLFDTDVAAAAAIESLHRLPRRFLIPVVQELSVNLDGLAYDRLRRVVVASGLQSWIDGRCRDLNWRKRVQAAQLCHLLPEADSNRRRLLNDGEPLVRARAVESLGSDDSVELAEVLLDMLEDASPAVRFAAQQALLRCDARLTPYLAAYLDRGGSGALYALEIAANRPDPSLIGSVSRYATAGDPNQREMVARALGNAGGTSGTVEVLDRLLADGSAEVRAASADAIGRGRTIELASSLGRALGDDSWTVRRAAGQALDALGPIGTLVLRVSLGHPDRFGRDMAKQVLDGIATRRGLPSLTVIDSLSEEHEDDDVGAAVPA